MNASAGLNHHDEWGSTHHQALADNIRRMLVESDEVTDGLQKSSQICSFVDLKWLKQWRLEISTCRVKEDLMADRQKPLNCDCMWSTYRSWKSPIA